MDLFFTITKHLSLCLNCTFTLRYNHNYYMIKIRIKINGLLYKMQQKWPMIDYLPFRLRWMQIFLHEFYPGFQTFAWKS